LPYQPTVAHSWPHNPPDPRASLPNIACKDPELRVRPIRALQTFCVAYTKARELFVKGSRDVVFPYWTYHTRLMVLNRSGPPPVMLALLYVTTNQFRARPTGAARAKVRPVANFWQKTAPPSLCVSHKPPSHERLITDTGPQQTPKSRRPGAQISRTRSGIPASLENPGQGFPQEHPCAQDRQCPQNTPKQRGTRLEPGTPRTGSNASGIVAGRDPPQLRRGKGAIPHVGTDELALLVQEDIVRVVKNTVGPKTSPSASVLGKSTTPCIH
jgi:hypothetical protein